jgi:hypothetical protein
LAVASLGSRVGRARRGVVGLPGPAVEGRDGLTLPWLCANTKTGSEMATKTNVTRAREILFFTAL